MSRGRYIDCATVACGLNELRHLHYQIQDEGLVEWLRQLELDE